MYNLKYAFLGSTYYSKELLLFLINNQLKPTVIFTIPEEFNISYSSTKVKNSNYADLKSIALSYDISYYEVDSTEGKRLQDYKYIIKDLDLLLVLGWYYMIPKSIRDLTKYGAWGMHASLLPKYAGGAPLVWAIINGEKETGITLFRMEDGVDDGDILVQERVVIEFKDTIKDVYNKVTIKSKEILKNTLTNVDNINFISQNKSKIEVFRQRNPDDGEINWNNGVIEIYNFIRAQTLPYPCAFSFLDNYKIKIIDAKIVDIKNQNFKNGEIVLLDNTTLVAIQNSFLDIGDIYVNEKRVKLNDYARSKNLWGKVFKSKKS